MAFDIELLKKIPGMHNLKSTVIRSTGYDYGDEIAFLFGIIILEQMLGSFKLDQQSIAHIMVSWQRILKLCYSSNHDLSLELAEELLEWLEEKRIDTSIIYADVNRNIGMQLRCQCNTLACIDYLRKAKIIINNWRNKYYTLFHKELDPKSQVPGIDDEFVQISFGIDENLDFILVQLSHECIEILEYWEALHHSKQGIELTKRHPALIAGTFSHIVNSARAYHYLNESALRDAGYDEALQLSKVIPTTPREAERHSVACWRLSKLAAEMAKNYDVHELLQIANRACTRWFNIDTIPYFSEYKSAIKGELLK
jgi:hypothetical protein